MNQNASLLAKLDKVTPFPATNACYRSRVYTASVGINPLIAACDNVLSIVTILTLVEYPDDRDKFLQDLVHEIRSFEHQAQIANYQSRVIVASRFALCALLDEIIGLSSWGRENNWSDNSLLSLFHDEKSSDEHFFAIIEHTLENISANLHLIELLYICLNLGFRGKYEGKENSSELAAITNKLYQIISQYNRTCHKDIFVSDKKTEEKSRPESSDNILARFSAKLSPLKFLWLVLGGVFIVGGIIYTTANFKLNNISKPIQSVVKKILNNDG